MADQESKPDSNERRITVPWTEDERLVAELFVGKRVISSVTEAEIRDFCRNCDRLTPDGICSDGSKYQLSCVARKWCGFSFVDGHQGKMTVEGFIPHP